MRKKRGIVLVPDGYKPNDDELWAAHIIATEYDVKVEFQNPNTQYGKPTADILVNGKAYEIKTPETDRPEPTYNLLAGGARQADMLIVNAHNTQLSVDRLKRIAARVLGKKRNLVEVLIIDRHGSITRVMR